MPGFGVSPEGTLLGLFPRNLNVTDVDLVVDKDATPGEPSLNLRGRDLRNAKLDRTDLHQADLTGADLDGASLVGSDLRGAWMGCADLNQLLLTDSRSAARCVSARGANLSKARLSGARMAGIDLRGARLEAAQLDGAQLSQALMGGANLASARLDLADLTGASLHGANLLLASLQGAELAGAKAQMADFTSASLQGANLSLVGLEGAVLRDGELDGASLRMAGLFGADLTGARLQGSDLTGAHVWRTRPPGGESSAFADMALIALRPASEEELANLGASLAFVEDGPIRQRLADTLAALGDAGQNAGWATSTEQQLWQGYAKSAADMVIADGYRARLTESLTRLMCRPRFASGAVAAGVARRRRPTASRGTCPPSTTGCARPTVRHHRPSGRACCAISPPPPTPRAGSSGPRGSRGARAHRAVPHSLARGGCGAGLADGVLGVLHGGLELDEDLQSRARPHVHDPVALGLQLREQLRHRAHGRGVDVVHEHDAAAAPLEPRHDAMDDAAGVAGAPVEGVDVDGELADVARLEVGDDGVAIAEERVAEERCDGLARRLLSRRERALDLGLGLVVGQAPEVGMRPGVGAQRVALVGHLLHDRPGARPPSRRPRRTWPWCIGRQARQGSAACSGGGVRRRR